MMREEKTTFPTPLFVSQLVAILVYLYVYTEVTAVSRGDR
jgi:hypothetical protein